MEELERRVWRERHMNNAAIENKNSHTQVEFFCQLLTSLWYGKEEMCAPRSMWAPAQRGGTAEEVAKISESWFMKRLGLAGDFS